MLKVAFQYRERVGPFAAFKWDFEGSEEELFQYRERVGPFAAMILAKGNKEKPVYSFNTAKGLAPLRLIKEAVIPHFYNGFQYRERVGPFAAYYLAFQKLV